MAAALRRKPRSCNVLAGTDGATGKRSWAKAAFREDTLGVNNPVVRSSLQSSMEMLSASGLPSLDRAGRRAFQQTERGWSHTAARAVRCPVHGKAPWCMESRGPGATNAIGHALCRGQVKGGLQSEELGPSLGLSRCKVRL